MYIAGRLRTASIPPRTLMESAVYVSTASRQFSELEEPSRSFSSFWFAPPPFDFFGLGSAFTLDAFVTAVAGSAWTSLDAIMLRFLDADGALAAVAFTAAEMTSSY